MAQWLVRWTWDLKAEKSNLRWTIIPSRGRRNTPSRFIPKEPEISAGTDEPPGSPNYDWGFSFERNCVLRRWESETLK